MAYPPKAPKLFGESETKSRQQKDARPLIVLRMTGKATLEEIQGQQKVAAEHFAPFGVRVAIIPFDLEFAGVVPAV
jgi:hypothetical protein